MNFVAFIRGSFLNYQTCQRKFVGVQFFIDICARKFSSLISHWHASDPLRWNLSYVSSYTAMGKIVTWKLIKDNWLVHTRLGAFRLSKNSRSELSKVLVGANEKENAKWPSHKWFYICFWSVDRVAGVCLNLKQGEEKQNQHNLGSF